MNQKIKYLLESLIPFIILGIAIALMIGLFIMFSYVLFWGLVIGAILWLVSLIKNLFLASDRKKVKNKGRIIEHKDEE